MHRLADHDARGLQLEGATAFGRDLAETVDRVAERVDDAAEVTLADADGEHLTGALHRLALLDSAELAEDDRTDLALFEVEGETEGSVLELQQFVRHGGGQALHLRDAVAGNADRSDLLARGRVRLVRLDKVLQCVPDLLRPDRELRHLGSLLSLLGPKFLKGVWGPTPRNLLQFLHGPTGPLVLLCSVWYAARGQPAMRRVASSRRSAMLPLMTSSPTRTTIPPRTSGSTSRLRCICRP